MKRMLMTVFMALLALSGRGGGTPKYACASFVEGVTGEKTGFFHMERKDGRWWAIDPLGRGFYFTGVQSANYSGVRDFLTQRFFYAENNKKLFRTRAAWTKDCIDKLTAWGFNMLGHGCERALEHKGLVHARELAMTQRLCKNPKDPDLSICVETTPACSAFPNVFHPNFEAYCTEFAQKHCAPYKDDPWVAGWYVDNELAWWGDREAHYQPRCNGLYETVVRLPKTHSAYTALQKFLADRGVKPGAPVPDALKREFLLYAAERYFSVTAKAIKAADPNHMLLGARFAGINGAADRAVFAIAARHSDVLTFNCYPWVDLDTNEIFVQQGGESVEKVFGEIYQLAQKPLLITEWSFPALDTGLPCAGGAGQRFATQELRAQASELWMRTLLALPYVAGWNYFRWVDQPASGIARHNREDTNYGLVNEKNDSYRPLVDVFTRLQKNVLAHRLQPLPAKKAAPKNLGNPQRLLDALAPPQKVTFTQTGKAFSVDVGGGFVCTGRKGGASMLESLSIGARKVGSYGGMMSYYRDKGQKVWLAANRVTDVAWRDLADGRGELTLRATAKDAQVSFALTHRLTFVPGSTKFLAECVKVENLGAKPIEIDRVYFRLHPAFAVDLPEKTQRIRPVWKLARQAAWTSPRGLLLGASTTADNVGVFRFYTEPNGNPHPDMGFFPGSTRTLAPKSSFVPESPMWILATVSDTGDGPQLPEPMFTPEQVKAIADEQDAKASSTFDLGGGVTAKLDGKGGFAFSCNGKTLAFDPFELSSPEAKVSFRAEGDAFIAEVTGNELDFGTAAFGKCSEKPSALYFGYGYYVKNPGSFSLNLNGHANAARFAGFDFPNGLSLVLATETAPECLYHSTAKESFGFKLAQPTTFTFVVGRKGTFDCALRYRKHFKVPAPAGFARKAGRFCVDSWNGTFNEFGELIRRAADDYGLKDDLLFYTHCWQRYGFDRHLPDVYPPSKTFGTAQALKAAADLAHARGWNFGVHLNVIDCYPDSSWFAWDKICHQLNKKTGTWEPAKAWINPPYQEQSYRLLPCYGSESIIYQMKQMLADGFTPDTVFIDVTGSGSFGANTCRDASGKVHSLIANTRENKRMFDTARALCSGAAYVSSEAPCDYMMGHLDGGDCQWMHLDKEPGVYRWMRVPGDVMEKTPWFPLVYHDRMALHGVGYSARFEGARGEDCHGIDSDDYISCEIMNGHALMADCYNRDAYKAEAGILEPLDVERCLRQVVRKYWLAQHIARELGTATVSRVSYVKGNPCHLHIVWSTGMNVFVNRAVKDWNCETGDPGLGAIPLPQYGFVAFNAKTQRYAAIRRRGGRVVEESAYPEGKKVVRYVNPRGDDTAVNRLPVAPETACLSKAGDVVRVKTTWQLLAGQQLPTGRLQVAYWLLDPMFREYSPRAAAQLVQTVETTLDTAVETTFTWPKGLKGPRVLHVAVSPRGASATNVTARFKLLGTAAFYKRYRQGTFDAKGVYTPFVCPDAHLWERLFPVAKPVDFGWIQTTEAFRLVTEPGKPDRKTLLPTGRPSAIPVATGCPSIVVEKPRARKKDVVVKATDFGFSEASDKNAAAIARALYACRKRKANRLELAPGTYRCLDEPGVVIRDFTDFTFDGKGAVLVFRRAAEYRGQPQSELILDKGNVLVQRCTRTQVGNFTMDWDWENDPLTDFVRVAGRHVDTKRPENSYVDFTLVDYDRHPKYPEPVPVQKLMAMDDCRTRFRAARGFHFGLTEGHFGAKNEWVKPNVLRIWPGIPMEGRNQNPVTGYRYSPSLNLRWVKDFTTNGLYRLQHAYYGKNGLNLDSNAHLTVKDVTVWSCFGMGMLVDGAQHHWEVDNFRVIPPTEAEFRAAYPGKRFFSRPISSTADGHHVARSKGDCSYVNCRWTLNNDDTSNFHDRMTIAVRASDRVLDIINLRGAEYLRAQPGTTLELRAPNFAPIGGPGGFRAKLLRVVGNRLFVDRDLPEQKGQCFLVWDRDYGTDRVLMKDCVFEDGGFRNIFSPSDITLDGCVFRRTAGVPVRFIADYRTDLWCEGMGATNLVVRNCLFEDTNVLNPKESCISTICVTPSDWEVGSVDKGFVGGGMLIEGCRFVNPGGYILDLACGKNVIYRNNKIELGPRAKLNPAQAGKFNVSAAENVLIQ